MIYKATKEIAKTADWMEKVKKAKLPDLKK
jgi:hypothetical protein